MSARPSEPTQVRIRSRCVSAVRSTGTASEAAVCERLEWVRSASRGAVTRSDFQSARPAQPAGSANPPRFCPALTPAGAPALEQPRRCRPIPPPTHALASSQETRPVFRPSELGHASRQQAADGDRSLQSSESHDGAMRAGGANHWLCGSAGGVRSAACTGR